MNRQTRIHRFLRIIAQNNPKNWKTKLVGGFIWKICSFFFGHAGFQERPFTASSKVCARIGGMSSRTFTSLPPILCCARSTFPTASCVGSSTVAFCWRWPCSTETTPSSAKCRRISSCVVERDIAHTITLCGTSPPRFRNVSTTSFGIYDFASIRTPPNSSSCFFNHRRTASTASSRSLSCGLLSLDSAADLPASASILRPPLPLPFVKEICGSTVVLGGGTHCQFAKPKFGVKINNIWVATT